MADDAGYEDVTKHTGYCGHAMAGQSMLGHRHSVLSEESHDVEEEQHAQIDEDSDEHDEDYPEMSGNVSRIKQHTDEEKHAIYAMLLHRTFFGVLKRGVIVAVVVETGVPLRTIQRIWKDGKDGDT
ncbi:hypothetical protein GUJ93_ZPchr0004g38804 [Zizania palustris]|uniref:DUF7769 domain-containing protein n=1 Tax=Zizania palustris TaxID=103762 RepID=A0A8J5S097_ZIZPA|nr:hypothetical protein GUJ93_ZPchr0004g38804 [Zizania palustris]